MADFKKYNGYYVKDASALAHASVSGSTLTTTDRDGRTVDSIELPGGLALSATHMSYWPKNLTKAYALSSSNIFINSNDSSAINNHYSLGQVLGDEMIGYGELTWDSTNSYFTLTGIRAVTTRGWRTFTKDIGNVSAATTKSNYINDLLRQFRPINYKAYLNVGMLNKSISIPAGSSKTVLTASTVLDLKDPAGYVNGYASIAKAIPAVGISDEGAGIQLYFGATNGTAIKDIVAYNPTSSAITLKSFVLELDVALFNDYAERFFFDAPNVPFIEGINCVSLNSDATDGMTEQTSVIVKHHDNTNSNYLWEFKLTLNESTGEWSWVRSNREALGQGPSSDTNRNMSFTFNHTILAGDYSTMQNYTSAVVYAIGGSGSSIGVNAYFTDAIPIPSWVNMPPPS